jgi:hypothetical protein
MGAVPLVKVPFTFVTLGMSPALHGRTVTPFSPMMKMIMVSSLVRRCCNLERLASKLIIKSLMYVPPTSNLLVSLSNLRLYQSGPISDTPRVLKREHAASTSPQSVGAHKKRFHGKLTGPVAILGVADALEAVATSFNIRKIRKILSTT